jgi:hypothetical protein
MLPYRGGEVRPVVGSRGCLMTHSAGSVTTQSIAFKYVMASKLCRYTLYYNRSKQLYHTLRITFY